MLQRACPVEASVKTGCSIPVVRLLWEQVDRVQFPAARQTAKARP